MPLPATTGQPACTADWFSSPGGRALLDSETDVIRQSLRERQGQAWLWLAPVVPEAGSQASLLDGRGLRLGSDGDGWHGTVRCSLPLPLTNESVATVVLQHVSGGGTQGRALFDECARVLVPGGWLWLFALNPVAPYRWRWNGNGLSATEPMLWRRRLRAAGMHPEPISQGIGPRWRIQPAPELQHGPGLRAAYVLRAEKRTLPLTPTRARAPLRIAQGLPTT